MTLDTPDFFRCATLSAKLTRKACIARHSAANGLSDPLTGLYSAFLKKYAEMSPCRTCVVGAAHLAGMPTPPFTCSSCGDPIVKGRCPSCLSKREAERAAACDVENEDMDDAFKPIFRSCHYCHRKFLAVKEGQGYCSPSHGYYHARQKAVCRAREKQLSSAIESAATVT
jgi:hypothetical protein